MFGYVKPLHPELKVREYELYKSVYCGLCKCMGRKISCFSRFTLSYDIVFLVLLRSALTGDIIKTKSGRCFIHPFKKRPYTLQNDSLAYCSEVSALLNYHKLRDDIRDHNGLRKLLSSLLLPAAKSMRKKACRLHDLDNLIADHLDKLHEIESVKTPSVDIPADIFGELLACVCEFNIDGHNKRIAREIGRHIGRWIYITDAVDDYFKDKKSGAYNPFVCMNINIEDIGETIKTTLIVELAQADKALNLIDTENTATLNILQNIINLGMINSTEKIFKERSL